MLKRYAGSDVSEYFAEVDYFYILLRHFKNNQSKELQTGMHRRRGLGL